MCLYKYTKMTACLPLLLQLHLNPTVYGLVCILICFYFYFCLSLLLCHFFFGGQNNRSLTITTTKAQQNGTMELLHFQWIENSGVEIIIHLSIHPFRFNKIKFTFESRQVLFFIHKWMLLNNKLIFSLD